MQHNYYNNKVQQKRYIQDYIISVISPCPARLMSHACSLRKTNDRGQKGTEQERLYNLAILLSRLWFLRKYPYHAAQRSYDSRPCRISQREGETGNVLLKVSMKCVIRVALQRLVEQFENVLLGFGAANRKKIAPWWQAPPSRSQPRPPTTLSMLTRVAWTAFDPTRFYSIGSHSRFNIHLLPYWNKYNGMLTPHSLLQYSLKQILNNSWYN